MKYRGQEYGKHLLPLNALVETEEAGKYRGVDVQYSVVTVAVPHPAAQLKYRGVSF